MAWRRLFGLGCKAPQSLPNPSNSFALRAAAVSAAVVLIACAAAQNVTYGWTLGAARSELSGVIMAGGALAAAIMAPVALSLAISERRWLVRIVALLLGAWCLAYGVSASLGFTSAAREA